MFGGGLLFVLFFLHSNFLFVMSNQKKEDKKKQEKTQPTMIQSPSVVMAPPTPSSLLVHIWSQRLWWVPSQKYFILTAALKDKHKHFYISV